MGGAEEQPAVVKQETPEPKSQQVKDQEGPPAIHTHRKGSLLTCPHLLPFSGVVSFPPGQEFLEMVKYQRTVCGECGY